MGARPLYYTQFGRTLLFGSEIKSLLAIPGVKRAPDEDAIADLVLDRWIDPHRTCFRDIYAVPPGHALHATPDRLIVRRHQDFDPCREIRYRSLDEYAEAFRDVFKQSIRRRIRSPRPVAVSVSGGVDSSSIFCQAAALARQDSAHQGIRGISMTFPAGSPADEEAFVSTLDAVAEHPVERMPVSEIRVLRDARRIIGHLERPELVWSTFPEVLGRARRAGCSVILDGYYGDEALFPRRYLVDLAYRGSWSKIRRDLREFGVWMNDDSRSFEIEFWNALGRSVLPRQLFHAVKRSAGRRRAARYPGWYSKAFVGRLLDRQMSRFESTHRFGSSHAEECFRNATAGHYHYHVQRLNAVADAHGMELASPFRDRELVAFLMAIPGDVVNWRGVPKGLFREATIGLLPEPIRTRRWKADFTFMFKRGVLADYDCISELLTPDSMAVAAGFVDGHGLEDRIARYRAVVAQDDDLAVPGVAGDDARRTGAVAAPFFRRRSDMYDLIAYGDMIADKGRTSAYARALESLVVPESVVLDIGTGAGILALLACRAGAARVYAVEAGGVIAVAREAAAANGFADRIRFIQAESTAVDLPERVDGIVSDIHGVLPLFQSSVVSILDARERLLKPGGWIVPERETLWAALFTSVPTHQQVVEAWNTEYGFDLSGARWRAANQSRRHRFAASDLISAPQRWATLDYRTMAGPNVDGEISWVVERPAIGHGIASWFDCEMQPGSASPTRRLRASSTCTRRRFSPGPRPFHSSAVMPFGCGCGHTWSATATSGRGRPT